MLRPLILHVYTGLTRNHRHDSEGRGGRGREEDSPNCRRSPYTGFSLYDARTTVTRNTGILSRRGFAHDRLRTSIRVGREIGEDTHPTSAAVLTLASLSMMLAQLSQETWGSRQGGGFAHGQTDNKKGTVSVCPKTRIHTNDQDARTRKPE